MFWGTNRIWIENTEHCVQVKGTGVRSREWGTGIDLSKILGENQNIGSERVVIIVESIGVS